MSLLLNIEHLRDVYKKRAGIIPYIVLDGQIRFLFGEDRISHDLTDFGGGSKKGESSFDTAYREFEEESNGIFPCLFYEKTVALFDENMVVIFMRVPNEWIELSKKFSSTENREISSVIWIDETQFVDALGYEPSAQIKIWSKIKKFLLKVPTQSLLDILHQ